MWHIYKPHENDDSSTRSMSMQHFDLNKSIFQCLLVSFFSFHKIEHGEGGILNDQLLILLLSSKRIGSLFACFQSLKVRGQS